jgi:hypothetical protein
VATSSMVRLIISATSLQEGGVISPAVLHNEVKCEVLEGLAQLPRTPCVRTSENPQKAKFAEFLACELRRTPYSGSPTSENLPSRYFVNKPPADVPETAGWHHNDGGAPVDKRGLVERRKLLCCRSKRRTRPWPAA